MSFPSLPSTLPFRSWGPIPTLTFLLGFVVACLGVTGEIALSNRRLMLGWLLLAFGAAWYYGKQSWMRCGVESLVDGLKSMAFWSQVLLAGYCLIYGRLPWVHL